MGGKRKRETKRNSGDRKGRETDRQTEVRRRESSHNEGKPLEDRNFYLTKFTYSELITPM